MTIPEQKHCFKLCYHFKCLFHFCLFISGFSFWLPPKNKFFDIHVNYHRRWVGKAQHICFNDPVFFFQPFFLEKLWSPCRRKFFQLKFNDKKEEEQNAKRKTTTNGKSDGNVCYHPKNFGLLQDSYYTCWKRPACTYRCYSVRVCLDGGVIMTLGRVVPATSVRHINSDIYGPLHALAVAYLK